MDNDVKFLKAEIGRIAKEWGWKPTYTNEAKQIIAFKNAGARCHIEVYLRSMRVITCMQHPKGCSVLERTKMGLTEVRKVFEDPRVHTGTGKRLDKLEKQLT